MSGEIVVLVTTPDADAERIANILVDERLAACVNFVCHMVSIYRWQDKLCREEEVLLIIKSNRSKWEALEERIKTLHPYEVPEIIAVPIELAHKPYLEWLNAQLKDSPVASGHE